MKSFVKKKKFTHTQRENMEEDGGGSCPICYDSFGDNDDESSSLSDIELGRTVNRIVSCSSNHAFCRNCLKNHCTIAVQERSVPILCPAQACSLPMEDSTVRDIFLGTVCIPAAPKHPPSQETDPPPTAHLNNDNNNNNDSRQDDNNNDKDNSTTVWQKYNRLQMLKNDKRLLMCTQCDRIHQDVVGRVLVCSCGHTFCRRHGDLVHPPDQSCADYDNAVLEQQQQQQQQPSSSSSSPLEMEGSSATTTNGSASATAAAAAASKRLMSRTTKPCPHCRVPIAKTAGCDHIVCTHCQRDFCWKCGSHEYLTGHTVRFCERCQAAYIDHRHMFRYRIRLCILSVVFLPLSLVYMTIATLLIVVVFCGCCGELCAGCCNNNNNSSSSSGDDQEQKQDEGMRNDLLLVMFFPVMQFLDGMGIYHLRATDEAEITS